MGYVKLLTGSDDSYPGSTALIPADNVASVKLSGNDELVVKYFSGYELLLSLDGSALQEDVVTIVEAIDKANGNSGKPILASLGENAKRVFTPFVQTWT